MPEVIANCDILENIKYSRVLPKALTEYGAIMLANVLRSPRAIDISIFIIRAFAKLRHRLSLNRELAEKISDLENKISTHDKAIQSLFSAIHELMNPITMEHTRIGFKLE